MKTGLSDTVHDMTWIVGLIDAATPAPKRPGPKPGTQYDKQQKSN